MPAKNIVKKMADEQINSAPQATLESLFDEYYHKRRQIYWMNLVRGVFFGFGSVIGGTLVVALLLWLLSVLQFIPFLDGIIEAAQTSLQKD